MEPEEKERGMYCTQTGSVTFKPSEFKTVFTAEGKFAGNDEKCLGGDSNQPSYKGPKFNAVTTVLLLFPLRIGFSSQLNYAGLGTSKLSPYCVLSLN